MFKKLLSKFNNNKKLVALGMAVVMCLSMSAICCASEGASTGVDGVVSTMTTSLSAANIWGTIAPIAAFIVIVVLVALGRRVLNKNLNNISKGKSGRV